ncbi:hypothetical protein [Photobacterium kishitanii]|uniref:Uncharacterized protein n=1 Tax=Photobacterium kishitanii TaxID=318456 RepID=A0A2T3KA10_9GAMM|nr:hypothetical protein [Photobacterium kishitanii]PSU87813.1 hypothetical protein C9J27_25980 [Photobacterium kishitanii]
MTLDKNDICEKLLAGWKLFNRGSRWIITEPRGAGEVEVQRHCDSEIIKDLIDEGVIKVACPFMTTRAVLVRDSYMLDRFGKAKLSSIKEQRY